nr:PQQ-binding-like beta-propeller repeat protein [uncultured Actinoplanes sp.]
MPADLDELFDTLARQADTIPLAGPDQARLRGRRRTRRQAMIAVAAAVVLVATGIGAGMRHSHRGDVQPLGTIPYVAPPIGLGGPGYGRAMTRDGDRAYGVWMRDGRTWMTAADLRSGKVLWPIRTIADAQRRIDRVVAVPDGPVVVETRAHDATRQLFAFSAGTGEQVWQATIPDEDSLVYSGRMLVRLSPADHRVIGLDYASGAQRWSVPVGAVRILGMRIPVDEELADQSGLPAVYADPRFVVITTDQSAQVRDVRTGRLERSVPVWPGSGAAMVAYDGFLFSHDEADDSSGPVQLRATDLYGQLGTDRAAPIPGRLVTMNACGRQRVCVITQAGSRTTVTAVDARTRQRAWQSSAVPGADHLTSARGRTIVGNGIFTPSAVFDTDGRPLLGTGEAVSWLDPDTLAVRARTGKLVRYVASTGVRTTLGTLPMGMQDPCVSSGARLACLGPDSLEILNVGG